MRKVKVSLITNIILVIVFVAVVTVSFFPYESATVYSKKGEAYYSGNTEKPNVSLMFNVYKDAETVKKIVDVLNDNGVKATFFIGGCWGDDNGETLNYLVKNGEEIGNHGYFHKDHKTLNYQKNKEEIYLTGVIVKALCGAELKLFAPPSGSYSDATLDAAIDLGYKVIMWSVDTIDWRDKDSEKVYKRATSNVKNGDLILMHPETHTLKALPNVIKTIKEKGYSIVTVSENINS